MNEPLEYNEIETLLSFINDSSIPIENRLKLTKIIKRFIVIIDIKKKKIIFYKSDIEKSVSRRGAELILKNNSSWSLPSIEDFNLLIEESKKEVGIEIQDFEYWAKDSDNTVILYNPRRKTILTEYNHNQYLNNDGGDFSTFTPFNELRSCLRLVFNI